MPWGADWSWEPGAGLVFEQWSQHVFVVRDGTYIDQFRCRAKTLPGRLRACERWLFATQWVQQQLTLASPTPTLLPLEGDVDA